MEKKKQACGLEEYSRDTDGQDFRLVPKVNRIDNTTLLNTWMDQTIIRE